LVNTKALLTLLLDTPNRLEPLEKEVVIGFGIIFTGMVKLSFYFSCWIKNTPLTYHLNKKMF
jgi:hypothetical protein